jgi:4-amino-4-deoxy-L-arabinose transferase-like glycosyltransferase
MYDERAHLALAETIDLHPDRFHAVFRSLDHPLLSIYTVKLSAVLFGDSNFGLRVLHVLFGAATMVPVFLIGCHVYLKRAGLWAAGLLAVDQFHASWSRFFMPEVPMLFFWSLVVLQALRLTAESATRSFVLLGLWLGLAYLAKETAILLLPVLWTFSIVCRRDLLADKRWYLAHLIMLLVISPDVVWNLLHFSESYFYRDAQMLSQAWQVQFKVASLYLGELIRAFINPHALDLDYEQGNAYAVHWPAGLLYVGAAFAAMCALLWSVGQPSAALRARRDASLVLVVLAFLVPVVAFTVLPGGGSYDPFWWPSPSLISAVVMAGGLLDRATSRTTIARVAGLFFVGYLGAHFVPLALRPGGPGGVGHPRATVETLVQGAIDDARGLMEENNLEEANEPLIYALNLGGPNAEVYYQLARVYYLRQEYETARTYLNKSLSLRPGHVEAEALLRRVGALERAP